MTKFERAKKQTLKKWEAILWDRLAYHNESVGCGFCKEYMLPILRIDQRDHRCRDCPVYKIEGLSCLFEILKYDDGTFIFALAILIYVEMMEVESE